MTLALVVTVTAVVACALITAVALWIERSAGGEDQS
jgi:hypothetical protein